MQALGLRDFDDYDSQVTWDVVELHHLIEELVVPETWFFRENGAFRELAARATAAHSARPEKIFRVLSAPCSTGEEPYSIAITLLDIGLPPKSFKIDAVDISKSALAAAERGVYRQHSFRGVEVDFRTRYFDLHEGEYQISSQVRECVRFFPANLADPSFLANEIAYQVIFCRNVLIYMHDEARTTALASLSRLLDPNGIFFAGHAEALESMSRHFRRAGASFAFARRATSTTPERRTERPKSRAQSNAPRSNATSIAALARAPAAPRAPAPKAPEPPQQTLAHAAEYADRGELERAAALCEQYMNERGPDADAYSLLGVVRKAQGQIDKAETCFSRALYLQPAHAEALLHMALICESRGEVAAAQNFRRRAERAARGPR
jgi:chemotaxis protein methyltransferase WspC